MNNASRLSLASNSQNATSPLRLLVLSNGHGEDLIAVRILQELQRQSNPPEIFALPLVGEGRAYEQLDIPFIGSVLTMPSGGFIYMDGRQLARDVRGGLLQLTLSQIKSVRRWVSSQKKLGYKRAILAVGDIVPLLFATFSGANYAFVGTAKSEYYVRDEAGLLPRKSKDARWENFSGSVYHPWERWLMSRRRCQAVFPRDALTTETLKQWPIPAFDLGNPMMDGLEPTFSRQQFYSENAQQQERVRPFVVTLLPGSRPPEAYTNWEIIMIAVSALMASFQERGSIFYTSSTVVFLGAIAPGLDSNILSQSVQSQGWQIQSACPIKLSDPNVLTFKQRNAYLMLTQKAYNDCLHLGDLAIAMAGTATEQFIGLGKPAIAFPGNGPQYNPAFAEAQSRLLGSSLILIDQPAEVAKVVQSLFKDPDILQIIAENGARRMGKSGAARRIADCLQERLA
ncbi:MAG: lipid-A-disaccharide synthase-related protein [Nostoc sp.]|uniref:lipid-A-disaccharide synthase-related protein n=1 Tax=Nostoc sp. TaxID=1180 RepID=UPI002FF91D11